MHGGIGEGKPHSHTWSASGLFLGDLVYFTEHKIFCYSEVVVAV
jgi:hypothetical protein